MKLTVEQRIRTGFSTALVVMLVVGTICYQSTMRLIETERWVAHTLQVREALQATQSSIDEAESAQRGYILTREEDFLKPYHAAESDLPRHIGRLREMTRDNPLQQRNLDNLKDHLDEKMAIVRTLVGRAVSGKSVGPDERRLNGARLPFHEPGARRDPADAGRGIAAAESA